MISLGLKKIERWPVGKHKGKKMSDLPLSYLQWAYLADFDKYLKTLIEKELERRGIDYESLLYDDPPVEEMNYNDLF